jgi:membrane protein required for colicin V production
MIIDIAFVIAILIAVFKGLRKGLILGIFSLLAFVIGLAAALKLSKWLPLISFMLVFIAVVFLVGLLARVVKKTMQFAMLGWLDSLGGMVLYVIIYTIIFSVFLFFAEKLFFIQSTTIHDSKLYPYIAPWGPKVIDNLGKIIPIFKDMFTELQDFFGNLAKKST